MMLVIAQKNNRNARFNNRSRQLEIGKDRPDGSCTFIDPVTRNQCGCRAVKYFDNHAVCKKHYHDLELQSQLSKLYASQTK